MSCVTVGQDWPNFAVERCSTSSQFDFPPTQRRSSAVAIIEPTGRKKNSNHARIHNEGSADMPTCDLSADNIIGSTERFAKERT